MKIIKITIGGGQAKIAPSGWAGPACLKATAEVEAAMGVTTASVPTGEMRQTATTTLTQGNG